MTRTILLARHGTHAEVGRVLSGRSEIGLSERGREEAAGLAARLSGVALASIHSSPRRRTLETAAALGPSIRVTPALDEVDFGAFTGRSFVELDGDPDWFRWNAERGSARCPGGETMGEAVDRAWSYIARIDEVDTPALVVRALGLPLDRIFQFDCDPASLTTLVFDGGDVRVAALNLPPV
jgi:ribonuclease H / adenosylcobalamin/alpha-ribazole phosphatase